MRPILLLLSLTLCTLSCKSKYQRAADEIAANAPKGPSHLNEGTQNYSIYIPKGWTDRYVTAYNTRYYILSALKTPDDPNTNINILSEGMMNLSLNDYTDKAIDLVKRSVPNAYILARGDISANGLKGKWYSYTMDAQGVKASLVSYVIPRNNIAYTITAGTQIEDARRYRPLFDSIARSFRLND